MKNVIVNVKQNYMYQVDNHNKRRGMNILLYYDSKLTFIM